MKKRFVPALLLASLCGASSFAQTAAPPPAQKAEKNQSIVIRKKGAAKEKTTIVIDGDKVTINGKPMSDYKSGDVEVITGDDFMTPPLPPAAPLAPFLPQGGSKMFTRSFNGRFNEAFLGVASSSDDGGATVETITKGSPAEKAGLQKGDVITKVGTDNIDDADDLMEAVVKHKPADKVAVTYKRNGKEATVTATLEKNKNEAFSWSSDFSNSRNGMHDFLMRWNDDKPQLGLRAQDLENGSGVKVLELNEDDSPAAKAGLKADDIITNINGKSVQSIKDIRDAMKDAKPGDDVKMSYLRSGTSQTATVHFPKPVETSDL